MSTTIINKPGLTATQAPLVCAYAITYNGKRFLHRCFQTFQDRTDYDNCRFVLVDNGSSDGSGDYVRENFSNVEVLRVFPNVGYPHGANEAIEHARRHGAKYIVLANDDIAILHQQWLREAVSHIERDPTIGIIGFDQVTADDDQHPEPDAKLTDVAYLSSPAMLMPIELFDRIGVFDEVYYLIADENDLGARAQAAGYRIVKFGIPVYHYGGGTSHAFSRKTAYLQMRNRIRFNLKNRNPFYALLGTVKMVDVACNPWPLTFDKGDVAHCRMRNSGNVFVNSLLWLRAVSWNIVRLPQTFRIRAADRQLIRTARATRQEPSVPPRHLVNAAATSQLTY